jgi:hypothetical protein
MYYKISSTNLKLVTNIIKRKLKFEKDQEVNVLSVYSFTFEFVI